MFIRNADQQTMLGEWSRFLFPRISFKEKMYIERGGQLGVSAEIGKNSAEIGKGSAEIGKDSAEMGKGSAEAQERLSWEAAATWTVAEKCGRN